MNTLLTGIYYGSAHGLCTPTKELPVLSHLATNYYALGLINVAFKHNNLTRHLSIETRLIISAVMTLASYAICHLANNEKVTTFMLHIPGAIASFSACSAGGAFGAYTLLMIYYNSILEFWPDKTPFKVFRVAIVHFSTLICGSILEKIAVIGRYLFFPIAGCEKGRKIIMGNLLEVGQTVWSLRP